jgi:hypothetical protein
MLVRLLRRHGPLSESRRRPVARSVAGSQAGLEYLGHNFNEASDDQDVDFRNRGHFLGTDASSRVYQDIHARRREHESVPTERPDRLGIGQPDSRADADELRNGFGRPRGANRYRRFEALFPVWRYVCERAAPPPPPRPCPKYHRTIPSARRRSRRRQPAVLVSTSKSRPFPGRRPTLRP